MCLSYTGVAYVSGTTSADSKWLFRNWAIFSNLILENSAAFDENEEKREAIKSGTYTGIRFMYNISYLKVQFLLKGTLYTHNKHPYTHTHTNTQSHTHTYTHTISAHTHTQSHTHTHRYTHIHSYICTHS